MKRLTLIACLALTGCANMTDRQRAVVGAVVLVAATSVALSTEHHGLSPLFAPAPGKAFLPETPNRDTSR